MSSSSSPADRRNSLPVYDKPTSPATLVALAPTTLSSHVTTSRELVQAYSRTVSDHVASGMKSFIDWEGALQHRVQSLSTQEEALNPGLLYISIATLSGSILARNRGFILRPLIPLSFLILSSAYCLPSTTSNIRSHLSALEAHHFPDLAVRHDELNKQADHVLKKAAAGAEVIRDHINALVERFRKE